MKAITIFILGMTLLAASSHAQLFNLVHSLGTPISNTGVDPNGPYSAGPDAVGYGELSGGGTDGFGDVYSLGTNGVLYNFTGGVDGAYPSGGLVLGGNTFYGVTFAGGASNGGVIFKVNYDGTGFAVLYTFTNGVDGGSPVSGLTLNGGTLYGSTASGGSGGVGTIFKISTNGTGFAVLHSIDLGTDGSNVSGRMVYSGGILYGTMQYNGTSGYGDIFSVNATTGSFTVMRAFNAAPDATTPVGGMLLNSNTLYGAGTRGGAAGFGALFKINTDNSGYSTFYSFTGGNDGSYPLGDLMVVGSLLYGATSEGGANGNGTIYSVSTNGMGINTLWSFSQLNFDDDSGLFENNDGANPIAGPLLIGNILMVATQNGGAFGSGTQFEISTDTTFSGSQYAFTTEVFAVDSSTPICGLTLLGNTFYGAGASGGFNGVGSIFKLNADGSGYSVIHTFTGTDASAPSAALTANGNTLYGTASQGGSGNSGAIFKVNTDGTGFAILHAFTNGLDGGNPEGSLVFSSNILYGMASVGGSNFFGTIFSYNLNNSVLTPLHAFSPATDGANPQAGLTLGGSTLYGCAYGRGAGGVGTVFKMNTDGSGFKVLLTFGTISGSGTNGLGQNPGANLLLVGNFLYGTTFTGGSGHEGTVFRIDTNGSNYSCLANFDTMTSGTQNNMYGANPLSGLALANGILYGTTPNGGAFGWGTIFGVATNANGATGLNVLHTCTASFFDGIQPESTLVQSGGLLYGTSRGGGSNSEGTVFNFAPVPPLLISNFQNQTVVYWQNDSGIHTLQTSTNLLSHNWSNAPAVNWTNYFNGEQYLGVQLTNPPNSSKAFFRLQH